MFRFFCSKLDPGNVISEALRLAEDPGRFCQEFSVDQTVAAEAAVEALWRHVITVIFVHDPGLLRRQTLVARTTNLEIEKQEMKY